MASFNPYDPTAAFLMGFGGNLLQAGGWSPQPVGLGQALGAGLQGGMQNYMQAVQMKRLQDQQRIEEGLQKAQIARMAAQQQAQEAYLAQLTPEQQTQARAQGVPEYIEAATKAPKAPQRRKLALPEGMVQEQEFTPEGWVDVGAPYSRRDPLYQVQGIDEQGRPVTQVLRRSEVEQQLRGEPGEELQRVTVGVGERKRPPQAQVMMEANTRAALEDIQTAKEILFTPEGELNRMATTTGMAGAPGSEGRTGYQALRRAVEVLLRSRTGAAAPAQEVDTYMSLYAPSPLDSDEAARNKMEQLEGIFNESMEIMNRGGFEWQGGDVSGELPAPTMEAGAKPSIEGMTDSQVLAIPPASVGDMSQEERDALDARLKAMGY